MRTRINKLKAEIKDMRAIDKLYDAIGECIYNTASSLAEEIDTDMDELMVAIEEVIYNTTHTNEELAERFEYDMEMRAYMKEFFEEEDVKEMITSEVLNFMEAEARAWLVAEDEWDTTTVANSIMGIHEGYRCEQKDVPAGILAWAKMHEDGDR